jgi:hypothetical protein
MKTTLKLSKTSKLDGILSWSLQALDTCPGSVGANGKLVDACSGCYATTGMYAFKTVKAPREFNKEDWKREGFVADMVSSLKKQKFFRWFDSGDMYSVDLAEKMLAVMEATPQVKHWLPTRMAKFPKFNAIIAKMQALDNVMVRFSADSVVGEFTKGVHGSVIYPMGTTPPAGTKPCGAYETDGKCNGCRACYDKTVETIAYPSHGHKMKKVIMLKAA